MIFTQFNMEDALEVRGEEKFQEGVEFGLARGEQKGEEKGEILKLISQIRKKQQKGATIEEISDALEEDFTHISPIFILIRDNPNMTDDLVLQQIFKNF